MSTLELEINVAVTVCFSHVGVVYYEFSINKDPKKRLSKQSSYPFKAEGPWGKGEITEFAKTF